MEPGYGDVEEAARRDNLVEVVFANGDTVQIDSTGLGLTGEFTVDVAEGRAAVLIRTVEGDREIDWMVIRSAADPAFAQELRERDAEEARRIGRRLRALRENRGMSQKAIAGVVGMSPPQLAKLEQGETDMRISTLRSLLRALDASFADIAGPDAPEVSVKEIRRRAQHVGVPPEVVNRIAEAVDPRELLEVIGRAFRWDPQSIIRNDLVLPVPAGQLTLKRRSTTKDDNQALLTLAEALAQRSALAYSGDPGTVPADPLTIRESVTDDATGITLDGLLDWCWNAGIIVVPMKAPGGFSAGAWLIGDQPVVILKEAPDYKAYWLFALAHELGHFALGHVARNGLIDVESVWGENDDDQENDANAYALELLVPGHVEMLKEIERRSAGSEAHKKFKFKAIDAAKSRNHNVPLVLLTAAFGLPNLAEPKDRWGSANNEAAKEGSAHRVVAKEFARHLDLEQLDRPDALLLRAVTLE